MIAGTLVIEDNVLHFRVASGEQDIAHYTVCDGLTGESDTLTAPAEHFMIALSIGARYDSSHASEADYAIAESVQSKNPKLRFIP